MPEIPQRTLAKTFGKPAPTSSPGKRDGASAPPFAPCDAWVDWTFPPVKGEVAIKARLLGDVGIYYHEGSGGFVVFHVPTDHRVMGNLSTEIGAMRIAEAIRQRIDPEVLAIDTPNDLLSALPSWFRGWALACKEARRYVDMPKGE